MRAAQLKESLLGKGLKKNEKVILIFTDCMQLLASLLACFLVKAVAVPLYFSSAEAIKESDKLMKGILNDSQATMCVVGSDINISYKVLKLIKESNTSLIFFPKVQRAKEGYCELLKYGKVILQFIFYAF